MKEAVFVNAKAGTLPLDAQGMQYYHAPMEGITGYLYRNAQKDHFRQPDKYFTPFIVPNGNRGLNHRERNDVAPEHNQGMYIVPQIMTNRAEDFLRTCRELKELGYGEVNLNLGCPSQTVVTKMRGAGFLAFPGKLQEFLEQIFEKADMEISVKTRLGMEEAEEFYPILEIYNKFPLKELIIHPRVQKDFYKNTPHMEVFGEAIRNCPHDICYNGDLFTVTDLLKFQKTYPQIKWVMIGRGFLVNPGFLDALWGQPVTKERLYAFHEQLLLGYTEVMSGDTNVLFKMKELWFYMIRMFEDADREARKIRKAQKLSDYKEIVRRLFQEKALAVPEYLQF